MSLFPISTPTFPLTGKGSDSRNFGREGSLWPAAATLDRHGIAADNRAGAPAQREGAMATSAGNQRFVDEITQEIIQPGVERLMESRYFTALRTGELTTRQLGGFAIQHYIHNMAVLKGFALVAVERVDGEQAHAVHGDGHGVGSEGGTTVRQGA